MLRGISRHHQMQNTAAPLLQRRLLDRGKTSGRVDDNEEAIVKRFRTFEEETLPVCRDVDISFLGTSLS